MNTQQLQTRPGQMVPAAPEIENLDTLANNLRGTALYQHVGDFSRALTLANAIQQLRFALTPAIMGQVMALQGSKLGFKTDKDKDGGYSMEVVRDCMIEATLLGAYPVNNEFNIISGTAYLAKNYFVRKVMREFPEASEVDLRLSVPVYTQAGNALVAAYCDVTIDGQKRHFERVEIKERVEKTGADGKVVMEEKTVFDGRIPVRVNAGMQVDAIHGKATRKMLAWVFEKLTGVNLDAATADIEEASGGAINHKVATTVSANGGKATRADALKDKLGGGEEPKPDRPVEEPKPEPAKRKAADRISDEQLDRLQSIIRGEQIDAESFLNAFGLKSLKQLPASRYEDAVKWCEPAPVVE
jgi:hypothetical protein